MSDAPSSTSASDHANGNDDASLREQLSMMTRAFMASPLRNTILWLAIAILAVILLTAFGQIILNRWSKSFYDSLERRDFSAFLTQLVVFLEIAGALLVVNVAQAWFSQMLRLKLRQGLTQDLIGQWLMPGRAFRMANAGAIGINPDQRLHEDARHLTDLSTDLAVGLLQAGILLVSFIGVLWSLSEGFAFHFGERVVAIPGYMVWAALAYAGIASWISWLAGRPLIKINGDRYAREAAFRFSLMQVNEHIDAVSLAAGEQHEKRRLERDLFSVLEISRSLISAVTRLTWITASYGWLTTVAPIVIAAPVYFTGNLTFGGLMMAVGAFNQVNASLRWLIDNIGGIADWRATLLRVSAFRSAMLLIDERHEAGNRVSFTESPNDRMVLKDLFVSSPSGCMRMKERMVDIGPGERILICGDADVNVTLFFRTIAGLWPWGAGTVKRPNGRNVTYLPRIPYFPPGSLRDAIAYPRPATGFSAADFAIALEKVGLKRLEPLLDKKLNGGFSLSDGEQRRLVFARLILNKPQWIVSDGAFIGLDKETLSQMTEIFRRDIPEATLIDIDRGTPDIKFFQKVVHLVKDPDGRLLKPFRSRIDKSLPGVSKRAQGEKA